MRKMDTEPDQVEFKQDSNRFLNKSSDKNLKTDRDAVARLKERIVSSRQAKEKRRKDIDVSQQQEMRNRVD